MVHNRNKNKSKTKQQKLHGIRDTYKKQHFKKKLIKKLKTMVRVWNACKR